MSYALTVEQADPSNQSSLKAMSEVQNKTNVQKWWQLGEKATAHDILWVWSYDFSPSLYKWFVFYLFWWFSLLQFEIKIDPPRKKVHKGKAQ